MFCNKKVKTYDSEFFVVVVVFFFFFFEWVIDGELMYWVNCVIGFIFGS